MSDNPTQTESGALEDRSGSHNTSEDEVKRLKADLNEIKELLHKVFLEKEQGYLRSDSQVVMEADVAPKVDSHHFADYESGYPQLGQLRAPWGEAAGQHC